MISVNHKISTFKLMLKMSNRQVYCQKLSIESAVLVFGRFKLAREMPKAGLFR